MKKYSIGKKIGKYLKPSEFQMVMFGVFVVIAVIAGITYFRAPQKFDAAVWYESLNETEKRQYEGIVEASRLGEDDPNLRQAERIREASGIGLGLSLYLVRERLSKGRFIALSDLMAEFARSEIKPPFCQVLLPDKPTDYGVIQTTRGIYYVRYAARPLQLEIIATGLGTAQTEGNLFILRIPDTSASGIPLDSVNSGKALSAGAWATLFEAPSNVNAYIPPPFAPADTFRGMNWEVRPLQQKEFSAENLSRLNEYLNQR